MTPHHWYSRGYLPHVDGNSIAQFITFKLHDSLPAIVLDRWRKELAELEESDAPHTLRRRIEAYLDSGQGSCYLRAPRIAAIVSRKIISMSDTSYRLYAWVVMPNHVHLLLRPNEGESISKLMQMLKGSTAHQANAKLGRTGPFWQRECFDRYIRDEKHFLAARTYIERNPVMARLCKRETDYRFSSARLRAVAGVQTQGA